MMRQILVPMLASIMLWSCTKADNGETRYATVLMRDGSSIRGFVVASSAKEIQLNDANKESRTIPMSQVRSIEYEEAVPPNAAVTAPTDKSSGTAAVTSQARERPHAVEAQITTKRHVLGVGTEISVRNDETIDSDKAVEGQSFSAEVTKDILDPEGDVVIPRGSRAQVVIRSASKGGSIRGASDLVLDLASVSIEGRLYDLSTADLERKGNPGVGANRRTGEFTGGGAAIGAIIGAIAGGGKGAAIGAGSGAGAGALTQILTKGRIKVPVESILTFQLDKSLRVQAAR